ncbi:MAG: hypothetical protein HVN34_12675 [Methanobacteriaceae archaeon]|jgi:hypothetical protein|nr:hypothetical protein [Methanobacteriaceae archaeon]
MESPEDFTKCECEGKLKFIESFIDYKPSLQEIKETDRRLIRWFLSVIRLTEDEVETIEKSLEVIKWIMIIVISLGVINS